MQCDTVWTLSGTRHTHPYHRFCAITSAFILAHSFQITYSGNFSCLQHASSPMETKRVLYIIQCSINTYIHTLSYTVIHCHTLSFVVILSYFVAICCHLLSFVVIHCHTFIHTYIQLHSYIHTYIDRQTDIHRQTYINTHTRIHAYTHTSIHPYIHTSIHPYIRTYVHTFMFFCTNIAFLLRFFLDSQF